MGKAIFKKLILIGSVVLFVGFIYLSLVVFDLEVLVSHTWQLFKHYNWLLFMTVCYFLAFVFRAFAWRMYGNEKQPFNIYLSALFYSLFFNHLFPVKVGDLVRASVLAKQKTVTWDTAMHSVVVMRVLDLLCLGSFSLIGALLLSVSLSYTFFLTLSVALISGGIVVLIVVKKKMHSFYSKHMNLLKEAFLQKKPFILVSLVFLSWVLEAAVLYSTVQALQMDLSFLKAVWTNSITIASQVFQFAPGGLVTYESTMSFALVQTGIDLEDGYYLAIITHGYKFLFSFLAGGVAFLLHPISVHHLQLWKRRKGKSS
jgi:uncharacterized membrane protein YbhN (UPF0104 family)